MSSITSSMMMSLTMSTDKSSQLKRPKGGDILCSRDIKESAKMYWPIRASGDIPFQTYRAMHVLSSKNYLQFLTELEGSESRHDFLFWVFDIITAGRTRNLTIIKSSILDEAAKHYMPDIGAIVNSCREKKDVNGSFSAYIVKEYPYIFEESAEDIQQNKEFLLSTYESWDDDQLWSYRNSNLKKLLYKVCRQINYNYVFYLNPMENLNIDDFSKKQCEKLPELRYKPEDDGYPEHIENLNYDYEDYDLLPSLVYFYEMLTFAGIVPGRDEGILINKNEYKQRQVETMMKKIDIEQLLPIDADQAINLALLKTLVIVKLVNTDGTSFERAQILLNDEFVVDDSVGIFCVDTGKCSIVSITNIFVFDFKDFKLNSFREVVIFPGKTEKKKLVTLAERIPLDKLPQKVAVGDFFCYDSGVFTDDGIEKYVFCGRPKKPANFFQGDETWNNKTSADDF